MQKHFLYHINYVKHVFLYENDFLINILLTKLTNLLNRVIFLMKFIKVK